MQGRMKAEQSARIMYGQARLDDGAQLDIMKKLTEAGFASLDAVRKASDDELLQVPGIGPAKLAKIRAW